MTMNEFNAKYDQYSNYNNLSKLLKRFSFAEKMRICAKYSQQFVECEYKHNLPIKSGLPLPWTLETFLMLAIEAKEYAYNDFKGQNENKFIKMANAIWGHLPNALECHKNVDFINYFVPLTSMTQFSIQEYPWIKFYRFWKLFGDNSSPTCLHDIFNSKFQAEYYDFVIVVRFLQIVFSSECVVSQKAIEYLLYEKFPNVRKALTISREDYILMQQSFLSSPREKSEYVYSLRPSYQYGFIEYEGLTYIPLPHLLTKNITTSLLYRITDHNDELRQSFGKNNLEAYLISIIRDANIYDEIFGEQEYFGLKKCLSKSPDVIARYKTSVLFLDSKSTVPSAKIRQINTDAFAKSIGIGAKNIAKLYKQIKQFEKYNPFEGAVSKELDCLWGIVVVLEDSYIMREQYYDEARKQLGIEKGTKDWEWLITHIKILDLYTIERACYSSKNLILAMEKAWKSGNYNNYSILEYIDDASQFTDEGIISFMEKAKHDVICLATDMHEKNLI